MALTIQERVGVAIRHFRILRGFTTKQVAVAMGWDPETRTHVSRHERGQGNMTLDVLARYADVLGVPPAALLREYEAPLDTPTRRSVQLRADGLTITEVARQQGVAPSTVYRRLAKARAERSKR